MNHLCVLLLDSLQHYSCLPYTVQPRTRHSRCHLISAAYRRIIIFLRLLATLLRPHRTPFAFFVATLCTHWTSRGSHHPFLQPVMVPLNFCVLYQQWHCSIQQWAHIFNDFSMWLIFLAIHLVEVPEVSCYRDAVKF